MKFKKTGIRLRNVGEGVFHNSREDCRTLAKACNILLEKVDDLVDEVNRLDKIVQEYEEANNISDRQKK